MVGNNHCYKKPEYIDKMRKAKFKNPKHYEKNIQIYNGGYILEYHPNHPFAMKGRPGYVAQHRIVMEKKLGRFLKPDEVVHHINGNVQDNRIENLQLFKNLVEHLSFHKKLKEEEKNLLSVPQPDLLSSYGERSFMLFKVNFQEVLKNEQ